MIKLPVQLLSEISKPLTTRPYTRRDSKKSWDMDHSFEQNAAGMKDEQVFREDGVIDEGQIDPQSVASCALPDFRIVLTIVLLRRLST